MNKKATLTLLLLATMLGGCSKIAMVMYGVKKPDFENATSIKQRQHEIFGKDYRVVTLTADAWKNKRSHPMPEVFVFSSDGYLIPYQDSLRPNCNGPAEQFLAELDRKRTYHKNEQITMQEFVKDLKFDGCGQRFIPNSDSADFFVFMTWSVWSGKKIHKEKTMIWHEALTANRNITASMHPLNIDFQDCWTEEEKALFSK